MKEASVDISIDPNNKYSNADYYVIRATDENFTQEVTVVQNGLPRLNFTDSNLKPNVRYYYLCYGQTVEGVATPGSIISLNPLASIPSLTFGNPTSTSIPIIVNTNNNTSTTQFFIQIALDSAFTQDVRTVANWSTSINFNVTGLSSGTKYYFRIKARNSDGVETSYSTTFSKATLPSAVTNLTEQTTVTQWHVSEEELGLF